MRRFLLSLAILIAWTAIAFAQVSSLNGQTGVIGLMISPQIRLTLTQGTPVTTTDVTAATSVYLEPYKGFMLPIYDGSANWVPLVVAPSTYSLPATQTQSCTLAGTTAVTGCVDTSQMAVGEQVTGTNIPIADTVAAITGPTSFTLSAPATGSGTQALTFKLQPNTAYDIYAVANGSAPKLIWSAAWSGSTPPARTLQNGLLVSASASTQLLVGSVNTSSVAGQLIDSALCRCLSNLYNPEPRILVLKEPTSTWIYSTGAWAQVNNGTPDQVAVMFTVPAFVDIEVTGMYTTSTGVYANAWVGVGVDSNNVPSSTNTIGNSATPNGIGVNTAEAKYLGSPGIGPHDFMWLQYGVGAGTTTWVGTGGAPDRIQTGMTGVVAN